MDPVSVTWYGQAGFRLAARDSRVLIDPFLTDRDDRRYPPPATAAEFAAAIVIPARARPVILTLPASGP
jgi:L-ascorbate metabolism protein UlaG (beta-lactamase superfamily)